MCKIKEILREKGNAIYSVQPESAILEALQIMAKQDIGVVLVVENSQIVGIFSERDCVYHLATNDGFSLFSPVRNVMTSPVYYVTTDQTMEDCMTVMSAKGIRHLPVLDHDELVGVISISDVVRTIVSEKDASIKDLENFLWVNMI